MKQSLEQLPKKPHRRGRPLRHPENDLRTAEEIAWWNENVAKHVAADRRPLPLAHIKLADAWVFDALQFLKELADVREMILRIPPLPAEPFDSDPNPPEYYTLSHRSRMQSAIDRIWHLEEDLRCLLHNRHLGQSTFAKKARPAKQPKPVQQRQEKIRAVRT
jgi:hypothetical protein